MKTTDNIQQSYLSQNQQETEREILTQSCASPEEEGNKEKDKEKKEYRLNIAPQQFPTLISKGWITTNDFCRLLNNIFRPSFLDYFGAKIELAQNKQLMITIYFKANSQEADIDRGLYKGIEPIITREKLKDTDAKIELLNRLASGNSIDNYKLTEQAKDILIPFISPKAFVGSGKNKKPDYSKISFEGNFKTNINDDGQIYIAVTLDLINVLKQIFGSTDHKGGKWNYQVYVAGPAGMPIQSVTGPVSNNWNLFIERVSNSDALNVASKLGYGFGNNALGVIVD